MIADLLMFFCHRHRANRGFTLVELMVTVSIIGILASVAVPSYVRYVNEAKAAEVLVHIHQITLAYVDASYDDSVNNIKDYDSPAFAKAPAAFADKDGLYQTENGFELASYVMSGSSLFSAISTPLILVRAPQDDLTILHALDHILKQQHTYVATNIIAIALSNQTTTAIGSSTSTITSAPTSVPTATPNAMPTAIPTQIPTAAPNLVPNLAPTLTTTPPTTATTGTSTGVSTGANTGTSSTSITTHSQPSAQCLSHPGWLKNHLHGC